MVSQQTFIMICNVNKQARDSSWAFLIRIGQLNTCIKLHRESDLEVYMRLWTKTDMTEKTNICLCSSAPLKQTCTHVHREQHTRARSSIWIQEEPCGAFTTIRSRSVNALVGAKTITWQAFVNIWQQRVILLSVLQQWHCAKRHIEMLIKREPLAGWQVAILITFQPPWPSICS